MSKIGSKKDVIATIPIHGPIVTPDTVLDLLAKHIDRDECTIYHIDVAPSVSLHSSIYYIYNYIFSTGPRS